MWPDVASSRWVISPSICRNDSTEISRSCAWSTSTKRDMCVPLKSCGSATYMLKLAIVCWSLPGAVADPHRVEDVLDADLVDRHAAGVGAALYVLDRDLRAPRLYRQPGRGLLA